MKRKKIGLGYEFHKIMSASLDPGHNQPNNSTKRQRLITASASLSDSTKSAALAIIDTPLIPSKDICNASIANIHEVPTEQNILKDIPNCSYCMAKRFEREPPGFCCSSGQVNLVAHQPPPTLWKFYTATGPLYQEFRTYVRTYNNTFAFTSLGVKFDHDLCQRNKGIYTFKAVGQLYHYINTLLPNDQNPSYLQLYFYDTEHELENRLRMSDRLNPTIIKEILQVLNTNPYSQFFRSLADVTNLQECNIVIKNKPSLDQRVYNAPTSSQVAAIWVEGESEHSANRDIIIYSKPGLPIRIWYYYGCYDSLQYPLLFPLGEPGWHPGIKRGISSSNNIGEGGALPEIITSSNVGRFLDSEEQVLQEGRHARNGVSCREYYSYKLQIRASQKSILLRAGRLFQQYAVDMYIKLESTRLDYFSHQQKRIRAELYSGIVDSIAVGERRGFKIGNRIILPATFIGGPRDLRRRYLDAMTLVKNYGKPDLFITITCNPSWPEIKQELLPNEEAQNRPDLLARVFRAKIEELKNDIFKKNIFGPVIAYVYVIEFQKRGLPHMHMLLILKQGHKILTPDQFDKFVCAEIPNQTDNPHLYQAVWKNMLHGPCGHLNLLNVCMKEGVCKNKYPKPFNNHTSQTEDSYPLYRRRDDGQKIKVRNHLLNNQWVIPYNPYLLAKYSCHLNVEICSTIKAVKYLYKYIYKGHDRIAFNVTDGTPNVDINEITNFREGRWVSPPEAMWRIFRFTLNEIYPPVLPLQVHLENHHSVTYADHSDLMDVIASPKSNKTQLTECFVLNQTNTTARNLLYCHMPEHFVWNNSAKEWTARKKGTVIGRLVSVSPIEGERYYLKLLLNHIKGATSFGDLKIFKNESCKSFRESAILHGLVEEEDSFRRALNEASAYQMPHSLRRLFATLLMHCNPVNAQSLWEEFCCSLSEDFTHRDGISQRAARTMCLRDISYQLESMGGDINTYMLIDQQIIFEGSEHGAREIDNELSIQFSADYIKSAAALNEDQKAAYHLILNSVFSSEKQAFFIDGPGGTGKTFLYNVLLDTVRSRGLIALATASSGVAASVLPGGRTAHSRFKIPLDISNKMTCTVKRQSGLAKLLRLSKLIIWDEAPMIRRQSIEAFERMLRDICECNQPFGGKVVVFGGDFRQLLPVVPKASIHQIMAASLVNSFIWPKLIKIRLTVNMRAIFDHGFSEFLLQLGEGRIQPIAGDEIMLPAAMTLRCDENDPIGEFHQYRSFDSAIELCQQGLQEDFFNNMNPSGFPPHILSLKINCPVILLRNIDPSMGLCNGTRLICKSFTKNVIGATIASGAYQGKHVFLPRIPLMPPTTEMNTFPFKRTQFPIRLCFCMTINKAQGQTLDFVGVYLPQPVFTHGQLYVALSRAKNASSIAVLITPPDEDPSTSGRTRNVVYKEILQLAAAN